MSEGELINPQPGRANHWIGEKRRPAKRVLLFRFWTRHL
jgi:hypothetical protein